MANAQAGTVLRHIHKLVAVHEAGQLKDHQLLERFAAGRDEQAFATPLQRHGPMVLGVCRRVLHHLHDAEDAFQATFLILARKAGSIRRSESVGGWLHQVAYHLAVKARASAARRASGLNPEACNKQGDLMASADPMAAATWQEVRTLLDAELQQLPDNYRDALVLCYLEGKTHEESAHQLGWSKG